jgi:pimeloyl-ACP methyl ester carboxylesterase
MSERHRRSAGMAMVLFVAFWACGPQNPVGRLVLSPCHVERLDSDARCGQLEVYENRAARSGRKIALRIVVLPSLLQPPLADPVFLLAGGPGQSIVQAARQLAFTSRLRRKRDVVLVDQRGTGGSNALSCDLGDRTDLPLFDDQMRPDRLRECLAHLPGDPRFYTTDAAMADLDDVRDALGDARINLWGGSYGTRAALVYMKMFPTRVRAVVLDAVAPYENRLPLYMARDAERALRMLEGDCAKTPDCAAAFPDLPQRLASLVARLEAAPATIRLRHPITGQEVDARITAETFLALIRLSLYSSDLAAMIPFVVTRGEAGDFGPFAAMAEQGTSKELTKVTSIGLFFSVVCAEDVPFIRPDELPRSGWFAAQSQRMVDTCSFWPHGEIPRDLREPVVSDVPTLLLVGALDPVTPPEWAQTAAKTLRRSRVVVVPGVAHITSPYGCVPKLIEKFIDTANPDSVDASCVGKEQRPPFVVGMAGPRP